MQVLSALNSATEAGPWVVTGSREPGGLRDERWLRRAIAARRKVLSERLVEPVLVAWKGILPAAALQPRMGTAYLGGRPRPRAVQPRRASLTLSLEGGSEVRGEAEWDDDQAKFRFASADGPFQARIPFGYHRLLVETADRVGEATVISAPTRCWSSEGGSQGWGLFAPLYGLASDRDWGAGDMAELEHILGSVAAAGGHAVATMPLLAAYLDEPFEPCPYRPVSRLFWNEFYLAVERIREWDLCAAARDLWSSEETQDRLARWRAEPFVDYRGVMALKRRAMEELCRFFFRSAGSGRRDALATYLREEPDALKYAEFRAHVDRSGKDWRYWPEGERSEIARLAVPEQLSDAGRYHLFCQWQMEEQLAALSVSSRGGEAREEARPAGLFLDLPVGLHPGGFDRWMRSDLFAEGMSIGAPPDSFFAAGQNWESPPLHPERIRDQGHSYYARMLRRHMGHAAYLRLDHVMWLHRLFWVPEGREAREGVYVDYPEEELYAALCLESHRNRTVVAGEDLGTVPIGVRTSMRRHGVWGTWVLQGALRPRATSVVAQVPREVVATLGTHDMFPLAGFILGYDIGARVQTGQLGPEAASRAQRARRKAVEKLSDLLVGRPFSGSASDLLRGALAYLGTSRAAFVLVNLDDLLLRTEPQNLPGTGPERANWRRRTARSRAEVQRVIEKAAQWLGGR